MVDVFIDDVSLERIQIKGDTMQLVFVNKEKDESLFIPVTEQELQNIFDKVKIRLDILRFNKS